MPHLCKSPRLVRYLLGTLAATALLTLFDPSQAEAIGWRRHYFRAYPYTGTFGPWWPPKRGTPWWYANIPYGYGNWVGWQGNHPGYWQGPDMHWHGDEMIVPPGAVDALPDDPPPMLPPAVMAPSLPGEGPLTVLKLDVPAEARVLLSGKATRSSGPTRTFGTRRLEPGQKYVDYAVRVEMEHGGQLLVREQTVTLAAGETRQLAIGVEDLVATRPATER